MAPSLKKTAVLISLTFAVLFAFAMSAFAISITSTEVQQSTPGMTVRTIWGQAQVYQYPVKINHVGYAHAELTFKPSWANADLYVYGPDEWDGVSSTIGYDYFNVNEGYLGDAKQGLPINTEYVDWYVPYINNTLLDPTKVGERSGGYVGDTYYIVVVAFDETCNVQICGYVPSIDVGYAGSADPTDDKPVLSGFRFPKSATAWQTVAGTPYGQPFAFTPTSEGDESITVQWPADVVAKQVTADHSLGRQPAEYESYLYASDWSTVLQDDFEGSRPGAASGWAPPAWSGNEGGISSPWYGYYEPVTVNGPASAAGWMSAPAGKVQYWVPSLGLVAASSTNGPEIVLPADPLNRTFADFDGAMKAGLSTVGYAATISLPQNLTISTRAVSVKKGQSVTIAGRLALDMGSGVAWQPGMSVTIERKAALGWVKTKSVVTGADGKFSATITPSVTTTWRARWTGTPAAGLTTETSLTRKVSVHN